MVFKKSLASVVSAALLMVGPGPLAAQMMTRGPVAVSVTPTIGAGLNSPVPGASSNIPTLAPVGALTGSIVPAAPVPVAAVQLRALAASDSGSPLAVIQSQDPAVGVDKKGAALAVLFDQAPVTGSESIAALGQSDGEKIAQEFEQAVTKIAVYYEKEGVNQELLSKQELQDLTSQLNYVSGLPDSQIPAKSLGYLEGVSIAIIKFLKVRRNRSENGVKAAGEAAERLRAKVVAIPNPTAAKAGPTVAVSAEVQWLKKFSDENRDKILGIKGVNSVWVRETALVVYLNGSVPLAKVKRALLRKFPALKDHLVQYEVIGWASFGGDQGLAPVGAIQPQALAAAADGLSSAQKSLRKFEKENSAKILSVEGVNSVGIGFSEDGSESLVITLDKSASLVQVKEALLSKVPELKLYPVSYEVRSWRPAAIEKFKRENSAKILSVKGVGSVGTGDGKAVVVYLDGSVPLAKVKQALLRKIPALKDYPVKYKVIGPVVLQASAQSSPVGALPPHVVKGREQDLKSYLALLGVDSVQVRLYADAPNGLAGGPNVVSIELPASLKILSLSQQYEEIGKVFQLLQTSLPQWPWLAGKIFEVGIQTRHTYRNAIPFPGRPLSAKAAQAVLTQLGKALIAAYSEPVAGLSPEARTVEQRPAGSEDVLQFIRKGGWVLYEREHTPGRISAQDYYLVWSGRVGPAGSRVQAVATSNPTAPAVSAATKANVHPQVLEEIRRHEPRMETALTLWGENGKDLDQPEVFARRAEAVLARVGKIVGETPQAHNVFRRMQSLVVAASWRYVEELLKQPEVRSALPNHPNDVTNEDVQIKSFNERYAQLVAILKMAGSVGDASISISGTDADALKDSWIINFLLPAPKGLMTYMLSSPESTRGRSQVYYDEIKKSYLYRESDIAGWTNLYVQLSNDGQQVVGLKLDKTLPDRNGVYTGEVYNTGLVVGTVRGKVIITDKSGRPIGAQG